MPLLFCLKNKKTCAQLGIDVEKFPTVIEMKKEINIQKKLRESGEGKLAAGYKINNPDHTKVYEYLKMECEDYYRKETHSSNSLK